jgi:GntR family transcriptional regulator
MYRLPACRVGRVEPVPLHPARHQTIAAELRRRIRSGELPVGAPMPSESELCREFAASRGPVRQAFAALRTDGLIGGGQGRRAVVLDAVAAQPFATLLSFSRWARMIGRTPGQRTQEIGFRRPEPAVAAALHLDTGDEAVSLVRLRLLDGEPAMVERTTFVASIGRALLGVDLDTVSIYAYLAEAGADLHTARHTLDAVAADGRDAALLGVSEGSPLLRERRLATTATGEPLEWSDDRYRPDVATVTITNTRCHRAAMVRSGG